MLRIFFITIISLISCAYPLTKSKVAATQISTQKMIYIDSKDPILIGIVCDSILNSGLGVCMPFQNNREADRNNGKSIKIDTEVTDSSINFFSNTGKSLLTLTLGVFLSNTASIKFQIQDLDNKEPIKNFHSSGRIGRWAVLPFYTGLVATSFGAIMNSYRNPDHLQKYCLADNISKPRKILEASKEDYCRDYSDYLKDSYNKVEEDILDSILKGDFKSNDKI